MDGATFYHTLFSQPENSVRRSHRAVSAYRSCSLKVSVISLELLPLTDAASNEICSAYFLRCISRGLKRNTIVNMANQK